MKNKIIERFTQLNNECKKYPRVPLGFHIGRGSVPFHEKDMIDNFAEDGFVEVFCLSPEEKTRVEDARQKVRQKVK